MSENRTSRRFPVHLPTKVVVNPDLTTSGATANISSAGVYLRLEGKLEVGEIVDFEITIPGSLIGSENEVHVDCHGRVVRCDAADADGHPGVACVIEQYEFVRDGKSGEE